MSGRKKGKLIITLKSDICVGSGYAYAGIVDSDTCYDETGLPFIPAKRLRGCIRESLETLLYSIYQDKEIERVFGIRGSDRGSSFMIDNAYITDYEGLREYLYDTQVCDAQEVLERFTHIIGQTRIENGVADRGSLRYTRVVNHYSPLDHKELVFRADFSCAEKDWQMICDGAAATRHIGMKRNRGLGNISISVEEDARAYESDTEKKNLIGRINCEDGKTVFCYAIKNIQPLMLSRSMEDESEDYIQGQQVLGMMASKYLSEDEHRADDEAFKALFLDGSSVFSNLYPYDGNHIYYPAADYLNRLKKTKKIVYNIGTDLPSENEISDSDFWYGNGNQPKKMKGKFVAWTGSDEVAVLEVKKDVVYHHSHRNMHEITGEDRVREEGILYSQEVVRRGQMFAGFIKVPAEYADIMERLLISDDLYFGKSKVAQYGKCILAKYKAGDSKSVTSYEAGDDIVVTFLSDAIVCNDKGEATVIYEEVRKAVAREMEIPQGLDEGKLISGLSSTTATGYIGVWNLRRPALPAIKAGSFLVFHLLGKYNQITSSIGERTLDGYGQIRIDNAAGCTYDSIVEKELHKNAGYEKDSSRAERLVIPIIYDRWLERKINQAISGKKSINVSNAAAGRFILMLRESMACENNPEKAFNEFGKRIESVKTDSTREEGQKLLKRLGQADMNKNWCLSDNSDFMTIDGMLSDDLKQSGMKEQIDERKKRWEEYVMAVLTDRKYKGRDN